MNFIMTSLLAVAVSCSIGDYQQYCTARYRRLCQGKGRHVACQFPIAGPGDSCQNYTQIIFNRDLRLFITNYLNRRRQKLAAGNERVRGGARLPQPQIMMQVEWDRELATLAQRLADQCTFVHDDCRATVRYPYAGQTVGEVRWRKLSNSDEMGVQRAIRRVFDAWWGERRRVVPRQMTEPFKIPVRGTVWGHFSQLATWSLRAAGCGAVKHGSVRPRVLLVCDFSHTNMLGQRTISPGPLAECPMHTVRRPRSLFPLLCGPVRQPANTDDPQMTDTDYITYVDNSTKYASMAEVEEATSDFQESGPKKPTTTMRTMYFSYNTLPEQQYRSPASFGARELNRRRTSAAIDRLQMVLEGRPTKMNIISTSTYNWRSRRTDFGHWRNSPYYSIQDYNKIDQEYTLNIRGSHTDETTDGHELDPYEVIANKMATTEKVVQQYFSPMRHRWQHTRDRPLRPGVNALLLVSTRKLIVPPEKYTKSKVSLNLDQEDAAQFYKDTGFKPDWRDRPRSIASNRSWNL